MRFLFHNKESTKICLAHYMRVPNRFFRTWDQAYLKAILRGAIWLTII